MINAKSAVATRLKDIVDGKDSTLEANAIIIDLVNSVRLEEGSEAEAARNKMNDEYKKLHEYRESLLDRLQQNQ